jgi:hypothetical protein
MGVGEARAFAPGSAGDMHCREAAEAHTPVAPKARRHHRLAVAVGVAVALPAGGAALLHAVGLAQASALAPQLSALAPLDLFADLRWLAVYHSSWWGFLLELASVLALRVSLWTLFVRAFWPVDRPLPRLASQLEATTSFALVATVALAPWVLLLFGARVVSLSWLVLAAVPPALGATMLLAHGPFRVAWWRELPKARLVAWVLASFGLLTLFGALEVHASAPWAVALGALAGACNVGAWRQATVALARGPAPRRIPLLAPAGALALLALATGGAALAFGAVRAGSAARPPASPSASIAARLNLREPAARARVGTSAPSPPVGELARTKARHALGHGRGRRPSGARRASRGWGSAVAAGRGLPPAGRAQGARLGPARPAINVRHVPRRLRRAARRGSCGGPGGPVLVAAGFATHGPGGPIVLGGVRATWFSYRGLDAAGRPLAYGPASTEAPLATLQSRFVTEIDALARRCGRRVRVVAVSEGALVAKTALVAHPNAPVDELVLVNPLLDPGGAYYPPAGAQGPGQVSEAGLAAIGAALRAISGIDVSPDTPLIRSIVEGGPALAAAMTAPLGGVRQVVVEPVGDAVVAPPSFAQALAQRGIELVAVPGFHNGALGNPSELAAIDAVLAGRLPASDAWRTAEEAISAAAAAWEAPPLAASLDPAAAPRINGLSAARLSVLPSPSE